MYMLIYLYSIPLYLCDDNKGLFDKTIHVSVYTLIIYILNFLNAVLVIIFYNINNKLQKLTKNSHHPVFNHKNADNGALETNNDKDNDSSINNIAVPLLMNE